MSSMTQCNYCQLKMHRARAKVRGHKILLREDDGWMVVYELPHWATLPKDKDEREAFHVSSMLEIGASCSC